MNTPTNKPCIDVCNSLLRGELSAIETYSQVITKFASDPVVTQLQRLRSEHAESAARLTENVRNMGGEPDTDSSVWGMFAKTVQATANLFGAESALESLISGESKGLTDYQNALESESVMPSCKTIIRSELLPRTERHIALLKSLADAA